MDDPSLFDGRRFDVAVIGGGVVGCAVARRFTLEGASTVLVEKSNDILAGASKGNSAILHTGFDAPPGSLERALVADGYREYLSIREAMNLPVLETDAIMVAWSDREETRLGELLEQAHANGIRGAALLTRRELRARVPALAEDAHAGLHVPGEHVIDPWSAPLAYLAQAVLNGAETLFTAEVLEGREDDAGWELRTSRGTVRAGFVVNCAGLYGDVVDARCLGRADFAIRPRKGQFLVFDKAASRLLGTILLPVPSARSKGIVVCPTIFGNVLVGPTAEDQESREDTSNDREVLQALQAEAARILPALGEMPVTAVYAGLRPATDEKDYRIQARPERRWITLGGIRSTGLTAALGIAGHAWAAYRAAGAEPRPREAIAVPSVPSLAEHGPRDWAEGGYGEIVCHCELVTAREIERAFASPVPPSDLAGLRRRTRATMGRCQGFYCLARIAELADGRLGEPISVGAAHG